MGILSAVSKLSLYQAIYLSAIPNSFCKLDLGISFGAAGDSMDHQNMTDSHHTYKVEADAFHVVNVLWLKQYYIVKTFLESNHIITQYFYKF